jgi:phage terminase large subunit-like protein
MTPAEEVVMRLAAELGPNAHRALDMLLGEFGVLELAALRYDWSFWAREEQRIDQLFARGARSVGLLTGRSWGKTRSIVEFLIGFAAAHPGARIGVAGQNEAKTREILFEGQSGLLAVAPPWFAPKYEPSLSRATFPNGAMVVGYSPEVPAGTRGPEHSLFVCDEIAAWPTNTREEMFSNIVMGLRLPPAQLVWATTPKRRHPLLRWLLERAASDPDHHVVIRGSSGANASNLARGVIDEWGAQFSGQKAREEIAGEFLDDDEASLFRSAWVDRTRRGLPERFARRIVSVDPAITADPRFSDSTGIVEMGKGTDGQVYLLSVALTGKHRAEVWPGMVVEAYVRGGCDLVLLETNRGGTAHAALIRLAARERGLELVELGANETPMARPGVVYVRTHNVRGSKGDRAAGAAALLERGRLSFVGRFDEFEDRLCVFDGEGRGFDDDIDAFVAGCHELAELGHETTSMTARVAGLGERVRATQAETDRGASLASRAAYQGSRGRRLF